MHPTISETIKAEGFTDKDAEKLYLEGLEWTRDPDPGNAEGAWTVKLGRRTLLLRGVPVEGRGIACPSLYWVPEGAGATMQRLARGAAAVVVKIGEEADRARVPLVFRNTETEDPEIVWGDEAGRKLDAAEIVSRTSAAFRSLGFAVSDEAIRHNLDAWRSDLKSGFRDEKNGVHLFSPCGCNPLRFWVSRLSEEGRGYQNTYAV